jgi:catechol-2,3-dioxygenase
MKFQGVVMNVADLDRSIDFYQAVLGFTLLSREDQLAAVCAPGSEQPQVIVLRAIGTGPVVGARHVGLRAFLLEVDTPEELERIASDLDARSLLVSRRDHADWTAVVTRDPDRVALVLVSHPGGGRITKDGWGSLDNFLYGIGE